MSEHNPVICVSSDSDYDSLNLPHPHTILYFSAPWCAPCKTFGPIFDKYAKETKDISFVKIDASIVTKAAATFKVRGIPALVLVTIEGDTLQTVQQVPGSERNLQSLLEQIR